MNSPPVNAGMAAGAREIKNLDFFRKPAPRGIKKPPREGREKAAQ